MKKVIKSILLVAALMAGVAYAAVEHQTVNTKEMADPGGTVRP
jgi:hypothetical protein